MPSILKPLWESQSLRFWIITILLVLSLMALGALGRIRDFWHLQEDISKYAVEMSAKQLEQSLQSKFTAVNLFAKQETAEFSQLISDPANETLRKAVWTKFQEQFPNITSLAFSDNYNIVRFSFGTFTKDRNYSQVRLFSRGLHPPVALHPAKADGYQYNIIFPWRFKGERKGVLYTSFKCESICEQLQTNQPKDHHLKLIASRAMEEEPEEDHIFHQTPVQASTHLPGTSWKITDQLDVGAQKQRYKEIIFTTSWVFAGFLVIAFIFYSLFNKQEKRLHRQERRYRDLLETSEDLIWSLDTNGCFTWISKECKKILGYSRENLIGKPFIQLSVQEEVKRDLETFQQILAGTPCHQHVTRQIHADGHEIYLSYNAVPMRDSAGKVIGITGTASNITARIESMHSLQEKEMRYRQMFEKNPAVKLIIDSNSGKITEANTTATNFYGYPLNTLTNMDIHQLNDIPQDESDAFLKSAREETVQYFQTQQILADGTQRDIELQAGLIHSDGHDDLYLIINDVTERNRSAQALQENEEKLRAIIDSAGEGILMTDDRGLIELFNPAAELMFGYPREDLIGKSISQLFAAKQEAETDDNLASYFLTNEERSTRLIRETLGLRSDQQEIPIRISLSEVTLDKKKHIVGLVQDLSEQHSNEQQLTYLAQHDVLTGLLNRREFERRLEVILSLSEMTEEEHTLCYIDVDQFKVINDTCSHAAGDELLKQLAILMKAHLRETEIIARLGGDDFGIILINCTIKRAESICDSLMQTVRNFLFTWQDQSFEVAICIGIAGFSPQNESASSLLSAADVACQMAKAQGRNQIHIYHSGDVDLIRRQGDMHLVPRINQALSEERFHLFVQPIAPVNGPKALKHHHYEVLVRMIDESGELVIPDTFIPAAERYILMPAIDRWIITKLFSTQGENLREWAKTNHGRHSFLFAVNLSGTSLTDDGFLSYLKRQFQDWDIPYRAICFEITETAAVSNMNKAKQLIEELKTLGCSFALDDFGSGLSSYRYLKELPVDYLKIDGAFVRNMKNDPVDHAMVDSINQIAHILGLKTIAEWAEDDATLSLLRALNIDYAQGYGIGGPQSLDEFKLQT